MEDVLNRIKYIQKDVRLSAIKCSWFDDVDIINGIYEHLCECKMLYMKYKLKEVSWDVVIKELIDLAILSVIYLDDCFDYEKCVDLYVANGKEYFLKISLPLLIDKWIYLLVQDTEYDDEDGYYHALLGSLVCNILQLVSVEGISSRLDRFIEKAGV